jgi:hypothetical protein
MTYEPYYILTLLLTSPFVGICPVTSIMDLFSRAKTMIEHGFADDLMTLGDNFFHCYTLSFFLHFFLL